jgi:hypothetical protein
MWAAIAREPDRIRSTLLAIAAIAALAHPSAANAFDSVRYQLASTSISSVGCGLPRLGAFN